MNATLKALLIVVLIIVAVLVGQRIYNSSQIVNASVKIGAVVPLTGNQAVYGQAVKEGLEIALSELNPTASRQMEVLFEDNAGDVKNTVSAAQKFIQVDHVVALTSSPSQHAVAIAPIAQKDKVVLYTMGATASSLNTAGEFVFKNDDTYLSVGTKIAELAYQAGHRNVGVLFASYNDATIDAKESFQKKLESLGGKVVGESFGKDTNDFKSMLTKVNAGQPTALFIDGLVKDNTLILKQMKEMGMKQQVYGNPGVEDPQVLDIAKDAAEGTVYVTYNPVPTENFSKKIEARYGHKPLRWSMEAYDGMHILALALSRIPSSQAVTSEALRHELTNIKSFDGETGHVTFDEEGNAHRELFLKTIRNGTFELMK